MEPTLDDALLTAYLDGELPPHERQRLEQRFAEEPELRQSLALLEETWQCLDLLELESADAEKIEATLKIAAVSVSKVTLPSLTINRWGRWGIAVMIGLIFCIVTFQFGRWTPFNEPSFRRMIARLDMYLVIADEEHGLELLQQLTEKRVFLPPSRSNDSSTSSQNEIDDRELYRLVFYRNSRRFHELEREKAEQILQLHRVIDQGHAELLLTLQNYYYWHKSLQSYERVALSQPKPPEEKAADIIERKTRLDRLQPEDADLIFSEIIGMEKSRPLAEMLTKLSTWQKNDLLNEEPIVIINKLKQLSHQPSD